MAPNPKDKVLQAQLEAPKFAEVTWWKDAGLRKLYALCAVIILSSATTGFDGYVPNILWIGIWGEARLC